MSKKKKINSVVKYWKKTDIKKQKNEQIANLRQTKKRPKIEKIDEKKTQKKK